MKKQTNEYTDEGVVCYQLLRNERLNKKKEIRKREVIHRNKVHIQRNTEWLVIWRISGLLIYWQSNVWTHIVKCIRQVQQEFKKADIYI